MIRFYCDLCGKDIDDVPHSITIMEHGDYTDKGIEDDTGAEHVCPNCRAMVENILNELRTKRESANGR